MADSLGEDIDATATELEKQIQAFLRIWQLPVPDRWIPAQVMQADDLCFDVLASLIVVQEVARFMLSVVRALPLQTVPFVEGIASRVKLDLRDRRLHRHLAAKCKAELGLVRSAVRQLTVMHEEAGVQRG